MSQNDERILKLKKQIGEKREYLSGNKIRFSPETNCVLELDESKYNLNVLDKDDLTLLLLKLNLLNMSANHLYIEAPSISGYSIKLWIKDIRNKLSVIAIKKEEADLKKMEAQLNKLLSEDKKTELEIDELEALLNQ